MTPTPKKISPRMWKQAAGSRDETAKSEQVSYPKSSIESDLLALMASAGEPKGRGDWKWSAGGVLWTESGKGWGKKDFFCTFCTGRAEDFPNSKSDDSGQMGETCVVPRASCGVWLRAYGPWKPKQAHCPTRYC